MRKISVLILFSVFCQLAAGAQPAGPWDSPPTIPVSTTHSVTVSTVEELEDAVFDIESDTTILVEPGTYNLNERLAFGNLGTLDNIAIRGSTGNRDDVIIVGKGMADDTVEYGIQFFDVHNSLIADLTVGEVYRHPIHLAGDGTDPAAVDNPSAITIHNCRIYDGGEQLIKAQSCHDSVVQYSVIGFTNTSRQGYTHGIDGYKCYRMTVQHNLFINQRGPAEDPDVGAAVLFWASSKDPIINGNTIYNCRQGVSLGLTSENNCVGGLIKNNFIYRASDAVNSPDSGILVWFSPSVDIFNNTVILNQTGMAPIEYRDSSGLKIHSNLVDPQNPAGGASGPIWYRSGDHASSVGNYTNANCGMFVDVGTVNLRLTSAAADSLAKVDREDDCLDDWDGDERSESTDVGADQYKSRVLVFTAGANGTISGAASQTVAYTADAAAVTAVPDDGYEFTGWSGDHTGTENPLTITNVTTDMMVTANFTEESTYDISGTVSGDIVEGVTITLSGDADATTETDADGNYQFTGLAPGKYSLNPDYGGYVFNPLDREVTITTAGSTGNDFTSSQSAGSYSISGTVSGDIVEGVTITLSGDNSGETTTDADGNYQFTGLAPGKYSLNPGYGGYVFNPLDREVTITDADSTGNDFTSSQSAGSYSISGTVSGDIVAGVTITLSGDNSGETTTDADGNYQFTGLAAGSYSLNPGWGGYVFNPADISVTITDSDSTGNNFTATAIEAITVGMLTVKLDNSGLGKDKLSIKKAALPDGIDSFDSFKVTVDDASFEGDLTPDKKGVKYQFKSEGGATPKIKVKIDTVKKLWDISVSKADIDTDIIPEDGIDICLYVNDTAVGVAGLEYDDMKVKTTVSGTETVAADMKKLMVKLDNSKPDKDKFMIKSASLDDAPATPTTAIVTVNGGAGSFVCSGDTGEWTDKNGKSSFKSAKEQTSKLKMAVLTEEKLWDINASKIEINGEVDVRTAGLGVVLSINGDAVQSYAYNYDELKVKTSVKYKQPK